IVVAVTLVIELAPLLGCRAAAKYLAQFFPSSLEFTPTVRPLIVHTENRHHCALTVIVEHLSEHSGAAKNRRCVLAFARCREARVVHRAAGGEHRAEPARIRAGLSCPAQRRLVTDNRDERGVPAPVLPVRPGSPGAVTERGVSGICGQHAFAATLLDAAWADKRHGGFDGLPRRDQPGRPTEGWR